MSSVLDKIYKNSEEVKDRVESIDNTLQRLYKAEVKENKAEDKERKDKELKRKRAIRKEKRDSADKKKGLFAAMNNQAKKKETNTIMDILKGALSGLGGVITNIFGMITSGISGLGIGALFTAALPIIGGAILVTLKSLLAAAAAGVAVKSAREVRESSANYNRGQGLTKGGTSFMSLDVEKIKQLIDESNTEEETKAGRKDAVDAVLAQMQQTKKSNDDLFRMEEARKGTPKSQWWMHGITDEAYNKQKALLAKNQKELTRLMDILMLNEDMSDKDLLQLQLNENRRTLDTLPKGVDRADFTAPNIFESLRDGAWGGFDYADVPKKQTGGFTVPGNSTGDNHPYMLPPGSFVLNRNAAQHFQTGGSPNLSPVLLESKEKVLLPGDPMMPMAMLMNDLVPRFQTGGRVVEYLTGEPGHPNYRADHGGSNYHEHLAFETTAGRNRAMEVLRANGIKIGSVNDGDHAPTSYHYKDLAFDVPASQVDVGKEPDLSQRVRRILKENGFGGVGLGGGGNPAAPGGGGSDNTFKNNMSGLFSGMGNAGIFASTVIGGIGDYLGQKIFGEGFSLSGLFGGAMGGLGSLFGMGEGPEPGANITGTGPVDMGADTNEKLRRAAQLALDAGFTKDQAKIMAAIAGGESTFNNMAHNNNRSTGDNSYGLWQINMIDSLGPERRRMLGISSNDELFDPATNARAAKLIFDRQGFGAWGAYKDGNASKYMNAAQALELQVGGITSVHGNRSSLNKSTEMIRAFGEAIAESTSAPPIIVYDDEPQANVHVATDSTLHQTPPEISTTPSATPAMHYMFYDLNYGPVV